MYKYLFEPLLNHKKFIEDNIKKDFSIVKGLLNDEKAKLNKIISKKEKTLKRLVKKQEESIAVSENRLYFSYIDRLLKDIKSQKNRVATADKEVKKKHEALVEAVKKRKILDKLKEKKRIAYNMKLNKKEHEFYNEVAITTYLRKSDNYE